MRQKNDEKHFKHSHHLQLF